MEMRNDAVFRINYLLGVSEKDLKNDFNREYEKSDSLRRFKNYCDAEILRSLCRVRQSFIKNYSKFENAKTYSTVEEVKNDVKYLKDKGIDIAKYFKGLGFVETVNCVTDMINTITYKLLIDLEVPFMDEMLNYFYVPDVTLQDIKKFSTICNENQMPYDLFIYGGEKIRQTLKYALHNDRNSIYSIFSIIGKSVDGDVENYIIADFRSEQGEDLDVNAVIDGDMVYENRLNIKKSIEEAKLKAIEEAKQKAETEKVNTANTTAINVVPTNVVQTVERVSVVDVMKGYNSLSTITLNSFVSKGQVEVLIDCRNVPFFRFIAMLPIFEQSKTVDKIVLVRNGESNTLWSTFENVYKGTLNIKSVSYDIKNDCSLHIVLTKEICESVYKNKVNKVVLFTNDSELFTYMSVVNDVEYAFAYMAEEVADKYLENIKKYNVVSYDMTEMTEVGRTYISEYKDSVLLYLFLHSLANLPLSEWSPAKLESILLNSIEMDHENVIYFDDIHKLVDTYYDAVSVKMVNNKVLVTLNDITFEAN
jgi:hypothetical protein